MKERLDADAIVARLRPETRVGWRVIVVPVAESTNDAVAAMAREGAPEGAVLIAERQTAGRGRLGRSWQSAEGLGLWLSALVRPRWDVSEAWRVTAAAALAVAETVEEVGGPPATVKWPNDVRLGDRKVAGILTELGMQGSRIGYAVVGIGLNVLHRADDFDGVVQETATSLAQEGVETDRVTVAATLIERLHAVLGRNGPELHDAWVRRCAMLGGPVVVRAGDRIVEGKAEAIEANGVLRIRLADGREERVASGEVVR